MPKDSSKVKKENRGSMPTEAQIESVKKELENMPVGSVIVRDGFKFASTSDGHIAFQKE
ncbi:MAG TPA: hypothetical protein VJG83_04890 [archaeon]|nr:hypothetical protein [archaeon]